MKKSMFSQKEILKAYSFAALPRKGAMALGVGVMLAGMAVFGPGAQASELVYKFINPGFGGDPFNQAYLLGTADAQNKFGDNGGGGALTEESTAEAFARNLESRLLSELAGEVTEAIFGEDPRESGTVVFGDQTITFVRGLEDILIQIHDAGTGTTTDISVPVLQ